MGPMDAGGRGVLPGLIDAHGHVMGLGLSRLRADLTGAASIEEVLQRLEAHAEKLPDDAWLVGRGWRSEEHTSELQSRGHLVCRLLLEKKNKTQMCMSISRW